MKKIFWIIPLFLLFACQNEDFSTTQELDSDKSQYELTSTQAQSKESLPRFLKILI